MGLTGYEIKSFDATSLTGSYQNLGSVLSDEAVGYTIYNTSDVDVYISRDASTNEIYLPASGTFSASSGQSDRSMFMLGKNVQLSVKQVTGAGASGDIIANIVTEN